MQLVSIKTKYNKDENITKLNDTSDYNAETSSKHNSVPRNCNWF